MVGNILNRAAEPGLLSSISVGQGLSIMEQSLIALGGNELQVLNRELEQGDETRAKACFGLISTCGSLSRSRRFSEAGVLRLSRIFQDASGTSILGRSTRA